MTKETKIGLLVGLAFIILFAIILSEKGANRGVGGTGLRVADATDEGSRTGSIPPLHDDGKLAVDEQLRPPGFVGLDDTAPIMDEPPNEKLVTSSLAADGEAVPALPDWLVERLNLPVESSDAADATSLQESPIDMTPIYVGADDIGEGIAERGADPMAIASSDRVSDMPDTRTERRTENAKPIPTRPPTIMTIHAVQPSECLGKIAARYYGRSTPARIKAIFDANRDVLKQIHSVRAGDKLRIPSLDEGENVTVARLQGLNGLNGLEFVPAGSAVGDGNVRIPIPLDAGSSFNSRSAINSDRTINPTGIVRDSMTSSRFRWYEIRSGDSLSTIARNELGSERRFAEIFDLNRDRLNNKHELKPGMKIRLPLGEKSPTMSASAVRYWDDFE
ncbi:MAG: LysM peptidoglycan-binding domain-containing protein [Planctomycetota bacterium]|nr:LysM peptidoglycan-binding domain-containing protein [Planctomycetota bacterium]